MTNLQLSVPDISCGHCKESSESAVRTLDGVARVEVAIEPRTVDVDFDESAVELGAIVAAIEEQGYEVASN